MSEQSKLHRELESINAWRHYRPVASVRAEQYQEAEQPSSRLACFACKEKAITAPPSGYKRYDLLAINGRDQAAGGTICGAILPASKNSIKL
jgi:hypothetical protein